MPRIVHGPERAGHHGFTLVELMVTLAVLGIVALVAVPGMQALVNNNRLTGMAGEMSAALQLARSEAIRRNAPVTVCGSADGTTCADTTAWDRWIVIGPDNAAGTVDVIRDSAVAGSVEINGPEDGIVFGPSGLTNGAATLTVCIPTTNPAQNQRDINVLISGSITNTTPTGGSGTCP